MNSGIPLMDNSNSIVSTTVAIDAHGGDHGPAVLVAAAIDAVGSDPTLEIVLVGLAEKIDPLLERVDPVLRKRLSLQTASHFLDSAARPVAALRRGQDSSMWNALLMVARGDADACVSAGSTAALMALGVKLVGMLDGIERPAIMSHIPSASGHTSLLDLGANLHVSAQQLVQFALMASVVREAEGGVQASVGLLNVGHEDGKGHATVNQANDILSGLDIDYRGFIEGHDIFAGKVDVAVCDGFTGNLVLKSSEGLARMLLARLKSGLSDSWRARAGALLARPALHSLLERFDPSKHNGAPLLGLNGVVIKSHGHSGREATVEALMEAVRESRRQVPGRIEAVIKKELAGAKYANDESAVDDSQGESKP
jgi:glycerol-3-phosphate acyltransferase PlsX